MSPFAQLIATVRIPPWSGPREVHILADERRGRPPGPQHHRRRWVPWTLLTEQNATRENYLAGLRCWRLIRP